MSSDPAKKRKRDVALKEFSTQPISVTHSKASSFPAIVASSRGVALPQLPFTPYTSYPEATSSNKKPRPTYHLQATNGRIEYTGTSTAPSSSPEAHYIAIFDPATNSVSFHPAPVIPISSRIVSTKAIDEELLARGGTSGNYDASRTALGEAFGTRKAQNALVSRKINAVRAEGMDDDVKNAIVGHVEEGAKGIPTTEMLGNMLESERPIPKFNKDAEQPEDVYKREDVVEEEEWDALWVSDWTKAGNVATKSTYVNNRANPLLTSNSNRPNMYKLKLLKYISHLVDFYSQSQKTRGRVGPVSRAKQWMPTASPSICEALYRKFTETTVDPNAKSAEDGKQKGERQTVSPKLEQKLMYWIAVIALMVDDYDVDLFDLKRDLNVQPKDIALTFKEVGCTVREMTKVQTAAANMTKAEASQHRRAVLKVPLEFPSAPRKRAVARGRR